MYTFKEYVSNVYLPYASIISKKDEYLKKERNMICRFFNYSMADKRLDEICENDIVEALSLLEQDRNSYRGVSQITLNRYRSSLSVVFGHALRQRIIKFNPVRYVKKYRETSRSRYLSSDETLQLLDECLVSKSKELYPIVYIAINTGMRFGEIKSLTKKNYINKHLILFGERTKSGKDRLVPLNEDARTLLENQLAKRLSGEFIFNTKSFRTAFKNALQRAGIEGFRFHDIRRTFATYLKDLNVDIHTISKLLGHSTVTMTERYLGTNEKKLIDSVDGIRLYTHRHI